MVNDNTALAIKSDDGTLALGDPKDRGNNKLNDIVRLGNIMAASGFFKDARTAGQACVKILAGDEMGIKPLAAMRGLFVIEGSIGMTSALVGAIIRGSKRHTFSIVSLTDQGCTLQFTVDGETMPEVSFTAEDAKNAGLNDKAMWKKYLQDMLFARALTRGARRYCQDLFLGAVYTPEELRDDAPREYEVSEPADEALDTGIPSGGFVKGAAGWEGIDDRPPRHDPHDLPAAPATPAASAPRAQPAQTAPTIAPKDLAAPLTDPDCPMCSVCHKPIGQYRMPDGKGGARMYSPTELVDICAAEERPAMCGSHLVRARARD